MVFALKIPYQDAQKLTLTPLTKDNINSITIHRESGDIKFKKESTSEGKPVWLMQQPYQIKAHQFRINTLLKLTQTPVSKLYDTSELKLSDYGLENPRAVIQFDDMKIAFGKNNPINNKRYIMSNNKMGLLLDETYPLVSAQPTSFIDLYLLQDKHITAISTPDIQLNKNNNQWQTNSGWSADQVQSFIQQWRSTQAFAVHRYMQRKQLGNIIIQTDSQKIIFEITDDDPWLILARPDIGIEYHLDAALKEKLLGNTDA